MRRPPARKPLQRIHIGDLRVSREPVILQTLLGSCVSACLFDPAAGVGGMNHIFLPGTPDLARYNGSTRFGINAMELLINGIMNLGGARGRLRAKIFGGAQILRNIPPALATGTRNVEFVEEFLETEDIPVLARDVGGTDTRVIKFHTDTGEALLRRVRNADVRHILEEEARLRRKVQDEMERDTEVTLFT